MLNLFTILIAGISLLRPSAVPIVTVDPYFSIWSTTDEAYASPTVHWTGHKQPLTCSVRVDGKTYRVLGSEMPESRILMPSISYELWDARYLVSNPPEGDWTSVSYDDSSWKEGPGAFGSEEYPVVRTQWSGAGADIWVRRKMFLDEEPGKDSRIILNYSHDDTFELYLNGSKIVDTGYSWKNDVSLELAPETKALLKKGQNVIAAHCHNSAGGSYVDFGMMELLNDGIMTGTAVQKSVRVDPLNTYYEFECGGISLEMNFTAPLLMDSLSLMSRPVNYATFSAKSEDGRKHSVQLFFEAAPDIVMDNEIMPVTTCVSTYGDIGYIKTGTDSQNILARRGDDVRIDWGYFYLAAGSDEGTLSVSDSRSARLEFVRNGRSLGAGGTVRTKNIRMTPVSMNFVADFGKVGREERSKHLMLAYDDIRSIRYFNENLRPYWNRDGRHSILDELSDAWKDYPAIMDKCRSFDRTLVSDAGEIGGEKYADLCALAYRQAVAAHKLVESKDGEPLFFSKECYSNGSIGTVDIAYPSSPLFLLYNTDLVKAMMTPILRYCRSRMWRHDFAAHDVGTYPWATGQTYNGQMPVEESGNMLIMAAAVSAIDGNTDYALKYWDTLKLWADYLLEHGLDPEEQLCTDDFAGHLAHNANLSVKAILGIAGFAKMAEMAGREDEAVKYRTAAVEMAGKWKEMAADGDHYSLTFDRKGTWSQKYNLVWDKVLNLGVFDESIIKDELEFYKGHINRYGLPLDSRRSYTKTDWIMWTAAMAEDRAKFERFTNPLWDFVNETQDRIPMSDWTDTHKPHHQAFQARSVVGGYYMMLLKSKMSLK